MNRDELEIVAARVALGMLKSEELQEAAVKALMAGLDSPSMRLLAGLQKGEAMEAVGLFNRALLELGISSLGREEAANLLAREVARQIITASIEPYVGAQRIWSVCLQAFEVPPVELHPFIYAASEWEDRPEEHASFTRGILEAARDLLD